MMMYEILAQEMVKDALREVDMNRLIKKAKQSRKIQNRQRLAKLTRLFRLTQTSKYVQATHRFKTSKNHNSCFVRLKGVVDQIGSSRR
jgi:hypothetical protein